MQVHAHFWKVLSASWRKMWACATPQCKLPLSEPNNSLIPCHPMPRIAYALSYLHMHTEIPDKTAASVCGGQGSLLAQVYW